MNEEIRYKILKILEQDPNISQRGLSNALGISLGKVNYCIQALKEKGLLKAHNFKNSTNKKGYIYMLTPRGIEEKARVTSTFLKQKLAEHEKLVREITELKDEVRLYKNKNQ